MIRQHSAKFAIAFLSCLLIRLIPFRPPNVEPILATQMPFSKHLGAWGGFLFAFLNIALFDAITGKVGLWTIITALSYGALGILSAYYFKHRSGVLHYVGFAVIGTLLYDAVTGLSIGPLFYGQPFMAALIGQIPFTLMHLLGNVSFAALLSPLIERWIVANKKLEFIHVPYLAR